MLTSPLVSIVIPTYNRADLVTDAVESCLLQTHALCETIVVDDGSTDGTAAVLERYAGRIVVIRQANTGLAGARNAGLRAARGEFVGFLDSDDKWLPTLVERALEVFAAHPDAGAVSLAERDIDLSGALLPRVHTKRTPGEYFTPEGLIGRDTGVGSGRPPMTRRALLLEHGGFDESFRNYAVDSEMWIRYAFVTRMTILREPLVLRRVHPGTVSGDLAQDALHWLRIMDRLESTHPEFVASHGALMRRTRGKQHLRLGRERLARCAGDAALLADARRHLRRAVALWPRFVRAWAYLAWSHLAPDTYSTFRKAELNNRS